LQTHCWLLCLQRGAFPACIEANFVVLHFPKVTFHCAYPCSHIVHLKFNMIKYKLPNSYKHLFLIYKMDRKYLLCGAVVRNKWVI
jgi:hypothetical protein